MRKLRNLYEKETKGYTIALLGNPNDRKSTVFNGLTGMKQHTGNWPGKTLNWLVALLHIMIDS